MFRKIIFSLAIFALIVPSFSLAATKTSVKVAKPAVTATKPKPVDPKTYLGRFMLETDSYNKLWYGEKSTGKRYFIKDGEDLKWLITKFGKVISDKELNAIPKNSAQVRGKALSKYSGQLVYASTSKDVVWYVNPGDKIKYRVESFSDFYKVIKVIGLKISDVNLKKLPMNLEQLTYDPTFSSVAYAGTDSDKCFDSSYGDTVLPLASMTKLMTALVLEDLPNIDWNAKITITREEIKYPGTLAQEGTTSEVPLRIGDVVNMYDLWVAMLTASSNQSAVILADNSGLSRAEFVVAMNKKAKDLGLSKTKFYEMTGLDPNNISTPKEFAVIAREAFKNPRISESTQVSDYVFEAIGEDGSVRNVNVKNRNYSLLAMGADASKTGFLIEAQRNVVIKKNGNIIVVMHALSTAQRNQILNKLMSKNQLSYK
ncbi:MAG: hypothetical protein WCV92_04595 [Candidatus Buchananbacteria bacterium]